MENIWTGVWQACLLPPAPARHFINAPCKTWIPHKSNRRCIWWLETTVQNCRQAPTQRHHFRHSECQQCRCLHWRCTANMSVDCIWACHWGWNWNIVKVIPSEIMWILSYSDVASQKLYAWHCTCAHENCRPVPENRRSVFSLEGCARQASTQETKPGHSRLE